MKKFNDVAADAAPVAVNGVSFNAQCVNRYDAVVKTAHAYSVESATEDGYTLVYLNNDIKGKVTTDGGIEEANEIALFDSGIKALIMSNTVLRHNIDEIVASGYAKLSGCRVSVVQILVPVGEEYSSPFSIKAVPTVIAPQTEDRIYNYVEKITLDLDNIAHIQMAELALEQNALVKPKRFYKSLIKTGVFGKVSLEDMNDFLEDQI